MKSEIVIAGYKGGVLSALYEDEKIYELALESASPQVCVGDIYIGKIKNIVKNLSAAFVEIRPGVMGYYPAAGSQAYHFTSRKSSAAAVTGDEILVQVSRENIKTKDWILTGDISYTGNYAVYFPFRTDIRISSRIDSEGARERLKKLAEDFPAPGGWMLRTLAKDSSDKDIIAEMQKLLDDHNEIMSTYRFRTCFSRLREGDRACVSMVRRSMKAGNCRIVTDLPQIYEQIRGMGNVSLYQDPSYSLIKLRGLESQLYRLLRKKVWLPSGGYLVIEQTEAMTVIDVNTGKATKKRNREENFFMVNMEAVREALRQIRARNISGMILIDVINMKSEAERSALLAQAEKYARRDPVQTKVVDLTKLQIMEITRRKERRSLQEQAAGLDLQSDSPF